MHQVRFVEFCPIEQNAFAAVAIYNLVISVKDTFNSCLIIMVGDLDLARSSSEIVTTWKYTLMKISDSNGRRGNVLRTWYAITLGSLHHLTLCDQSKNDALFKFS